GGDLRAFEQLVRISVDLRIRGGKLGLYLRPVGVELLGQNERQGRHDALPHFRRRTEDRHGIVGADGDPGIDPWNLRGAQRVGHAAQAGSVKANISPAAPSTKPRRLTAVATDAWLVCLVMA